jgi:hypothetical protein
LLGLEKGFDWFKMSDSSISVINESAKSEVGDTLNFKHHECAKRSYIATPHYLHFSQLPA